MNSNERRVERHLAQHEERAKITERDPDTGLCLGCDQIKCECEEPIADVIRRPCEDTNQMQAVPPYPPRPTGPVRNPRDENPSAECQMLRERVALLSEIEKRAAAVAQWADATWIGHPARMDVYVLRGALDRASGSARTVRQAVPR